MRLQDKVALITGAGSGIGREAALLFAKEGAAIVVVDVNDQAARDTAALIDKAIHVRADVSKASDCQQMVAAAEKAFGKLDVLFNNAGIMHAKDDDAVSTDEGIWDLTLDINAKGVFLGCKYGIPALRRAGGGSVINTASFVARLGAATPQIAYTASKGAVLAMTRELAVVHARENIRINALSPGPLRTELLMSYLNTEEKRRRRLVHVPMGRFGEAKEIAQAALYLASDESSYVTGTEFLVDGGLTAAYVTPERPCVTSKISLQDRNSDPGVCGSRRSGSRASPPNSTRSPSISTRRPRAARYSAAWRQAAGTPPRSPCGSWSRASSSPRAALSAPVSTSSAGRGRYGPGMSCIWKAKCSKCGLRKRVRSKGWSRCARRR